MTGAATGTVIELFDRSDSVCVFDDGSSATTRSLAADGRRLAGWLVSHGFEPGDRVAIHLSNGAAHVRLLLACAAAGLVAVEVNTRFSSREVDDIVRRSGARVVEAEWPGWDDASATSGVAPADSPFVVFTTSGTTSAPKLVLHDQRSIVRHAHDAASWLGYRGDDVAMVALPLCGTFGLTSFMCAVAAGSPIVVTNFDTARSAALIERHHVSVINGTDDMYHRLLDVGADVSTIRIGGCARFNSSLDRVMADADRAGATLVGLYGMSEVQALFTARPPTLSLTERERAGGTMVSTDARYRVVDGELQLRSPNMMVGYLADGGDAVDHDLTGAHLDDGWFRTGDLAVGEDDRSFHYIARLGDAMRLGGFLVDPREIESVLAELDGVDAAQVVAVDRPDGARPVAFVVGVVDERAAIEHCRARLAIYKVPVRVAAVSAFPATEGANGTKIQRNALRAMAAELLA